MKKLYVASALLVLSFKASSAQTLSTQPGTQTSSISTVYPGCELPAKTYSRTITLDASKGDTLQSYFTKKLIQPGDHIILKGPQGKFLTSKYTNPSLVDNKQWILIEGSGALFTQIDVRDIGRIAFTKVSVSGGAVTFGGANNVVFYDNKVFGGADSSRWEVRDWLAIHSGVASDNSKCVSITKNLLMNLRFGITASTRAKISSESAVNVLIHENTLKNLSGDFMRPIGSNITISNNNASDGYVSIADGDSNHDDFIQGFAYPLGIEFSNVKVLNNSFQETTNSNRRFQSSYQGISVFDGLYTNFLIKGNTLLASAYHGIAMYWGRDGIIENNTVMSTYKIKPRNFWIRVTDSKAGVSAKNITVRNNIANAVILSKVAGAVTASNNYAIPSEQGSKNFVKFDVVNEIFNLNLLPSSLAYGKGAGSK